MCVLIWLFCTVYVSHQKMEKTLITRILRVYILSSTCDTYYLYQVVPGHAGKKVAIRWLEEMDDLEKVQHCINE